MKYWIIVNDTRLGPMDLEQLIATPGFGPESPVWREGLPDWVSARNLPELADRFTQPVQRAYNQFRQQQQYWQQPTYAPGMPQPAPQEPMPSTYLAWAILSTICCCIPTGVIAIIYASRVSPLYIRGDVYGSRRASEKAALWTIISFVAGLIWTPFSIIWSLLTM